MPPDVNELSISIDMQLRRRALKLVPGGMTGHLNAAARHQQALGIA